MAFRRWHTMETAPKDGTMVELKSDRHPGQLQFMAWIESRWEGLAFTPMGSRRIYWDTEDPPTHWRPVE